jgi:hypothetical protein
MDLIDIEYEGMDWIQMARDVLPWFITIFATAHYCILFSAIQNQSTILQPIFPKPILILSLYLRLRLNIVVEWLACNTDMNGRPIGSLATGST